MTVGLTSKLQASGKTINKGWVQLSTRFRGNGLSTKYFGDEPPLRSELFSADQMKLHGKSLAAIVFCLGIGCPGSQVSP